VTRTPGKPVALSTDDLFGVRRIGDHRLRQHRPHRGADRRPPAGHQRAPEPAEQHTNIACPGRPVPRSSAAPRRRCQRADHADAGEYQNPSSSPEVPPFPTVATDTRGSTVSTRVCGSTGTGRHGDGKHVVIATQAPYRWPATSRTGSGAAFVASQVEVTAAVPAADHADSGPSGHGTPSPRRRDLRATEPAPDNGVIATVTRPSFPTPP